MLKTLILQTTFGQIFFSKESFFGEEKTSDSDISLTAGLISAIYSMTEETQEQKIEEIDLEDLKSVFRELPGERLFIVTVDKRMDDQDASDLLSDIIDGFFNQYGDIQTDGMILKDFEPTVDEIVNNKLWYNTDLPSMGLGDVLVFLSLIFSVIWYPYWFLNGQKTIADRLFTGLNAGIGGLLLAILIVLLGTAGPLGMNAFLLQRYPSLRLYFRFTKEFFVRPTRGGYAENLPAWFVGIPVLISAIIISTMVNGRGMVYGWNVKPLSDGFIGAVKIVDANGNETSLVWNYLALFFGLYLIVWFFIFPSLLGAITGNLDWNFLKSSSIVTSFGQLILLPGHVFAGKIYQEILGIPVEDGSAYADVVQTLGYIFSVTVLVDIFLLISIFFMAIGLNRLIKKNTGRFGFAFGISIFVVFESLRLFYFIIFQSGLFFFIAFA